MSNYYDPTPAELDDMLKVSGKLTPVITAETEEQAARRIFRMALPSAARTVVDIAENSLNDRTRLQAAQYIIERNLGRVGEDVAHASSDALRMMVDGFEHDLRTGKFSM